MHLKDISIDVTWHAGPDGQSFLDSSPPAHPDLTDSVFTSPEWFSAAASTLMQDRVPLVLAAHVGATEHLVLAFSVGRERIQGIPLRTIRLLGFPLGDRHPLGILPGSRMADIFDAALGKFPVSCNAFILDELPEADAAALADIASKHGMYTRARDSARSPYLHLDKNLRPEERDQMYSRSLRKRINRANKKLRAAGSAEIRISCPKPAEIAGVLEDLREIERQSWKGDSGVGIFSEDATWPFLVKLAVALAPLGGIQVAELFLDAKLIAYRFSFVVDNVVYDYNFAHLPEFSHLSPGRILLDEVIGFAIAERKQAIDGSRGHLATPQLLADWTKNSLKHTTLWLYPRTIGGLTTYWIISAGSRLKSAIARLRSASS
jgi:CelD/BcsL family acetyltransferase involved in cellulose biosynthesis